MPTTASTTAALRPRPSRLDVALAVLASAAGLLFAYMSYSGGPTNSVADGGPFTVSVWSVPAFLIITLPILWRTSAPLVALGGTIAGLLVHAAAFGAIIHCGVSYPVIAILAYAAGNRLRGTDRQIGLGLAVIAAVTTGVTDVLGAGTIVVGLPAAIVGFGLGVAVAGRARLTPVSEQAVRA